MAAISVLLCLAVALLSLPFVGPIRGWLVSADAGAILVLLLAAFVSRGTSGVIERREVRAGYTTLDDRYRDLPQLDPRTGAVVRLAGAAYLARRKDKK